MSAVIHYAVGIGFRRHCHIQELIALIDQGLAASGLAADRIDWLASLDRKTREAPFTAVSRHYGWRVCALDHSQLQEAPAAAPAASAVQAHLGLAGVAEQAALAALTGWPDAQPELLLPKRRSTAATLAIAYIQLTANSPPDS